MHREVRHARRFREARPVKYHHCSVAAATVLFPVLEGNLRVLPLPIAEGKLAYIAARGCLTIDRMLSNALRPSSRALLRALSPDLISIESLCFFSFFSFSLFFPLVFCAYTLLGVVQGTVGKMRRRVDISQLGFCLRFTAICSCF